MAKRMKLGEKALTQAAKAGWVVFNKLNSISPNASFTPKVERQAAAQELPEREAASRLATHYGLAVPQVHS